MNTGAMKRRKGQVGEREFFRLLSDELGTCVRRNIDQARNGGADCVEVPGWAIEVKRHEAGFRQAWWEQACEQAAEAQKWPALAYRASRQPWRVRIALESSLKSFTDYADLMTFDIWMEIDLATFAMIVREMRERNRN